MPIDDEQVLAALRSVKDPELYKDIITLGRVKEFMVDETTVHLRLDFGKTAAHVKQAIERDIKEALRNIGAQAVDIQNVGVVVPAEAAAARPSALPQVKYVIAVGAGKGGVGKSTLAL